MTIGALIVLALGLSMDAFAVSVSNSLCCAGLTKRQAVQASGAYGFFQGLMPLLGCLAGTLFASIVQQWDHWLAFILLVLIGGKMLVEAIREMRSNEPESCPASLSGKQILIQAVATSIDALAVGVSLAALSVNIWSASALIAVITFACCLVGHAIGKRFGAMLGKKAEILGGTILVLLGVKILTEHLGLLG